MKAFVVLALLLAACRAPAPPSSPPLPSTPPPPPPSRVVPAVRVSGVVLGSDGHRVSGAGVLVGAAQRDCVPAAAIGAVTDENGQFSVTIEGNVDSRCVVAEARSGGASGLATAPAAFSVPPGVVELTVRLNPPAPLTAAEAERLVRLLAAAIDDPAAPVDELMLFIAGGSEALRVAVEQHRQVLGRVTRIRELTPSVEPSSHYRHFTFELRGESGRTLHVDAHQEALTRLHDLLLDYGWRSERFMNAYVRAIASGDAVRLSQILNPDDIDFPVERAREMIVAYRLRYRDTATIRPEFVSVDEKLHRITWRLRGTGADGRELTEDIVLQTGDGLIGVVGL